MIKLFALTAVFFLLSPQVHATNEVTMRIERSKTVHCGYSNLYPLVFYNPDKRAMDGIIPEYLAKTAERLKLRIVWTQEVSKDRVFAMLRGGRIDMMCTPLAYEPDETKNLSLVSSLGNLRHNMYVPFNSPLTDDHVQSVKIAYIATASVKSSMDQTFLPSNLIALPASTKLSDLMDYMKYAKASAVILDEFSAQSHLKANPNSIRTLTDQTISVSSLSFATLPNDTEWFAKAKQLTDPTIPANKEILKGLAKKYNVPPESINAYP